MFWIIGASFAEFYVVRCFNDISEQKINNYNNLNIVAFYGLQMLIEVRNKSPPSRFNSIFGLFKALLIRC